MIAASENPNYFIKFGWFSRDKDEEDRVGCPCFVCDFKGVLPTEPTSVHGIVYVKVFATRKLNMTKMHLIEDEQNFNFDEIKDGEAFTMRDEAGRYEAETFIFSKGLIVSHIIFAP